jgi:hypothetical protein
MSSAHAVRGKSIRSVMGDDCKEKGPTKVEPDGHHHDAGWSAMAVGPIACDPNRIFPSIFLKFCVFVIPSIMGSLT